MYRVPILANLDIGKHESEIVDTLHKKSILGEDRSTTTLMFVETRSSRQQVVVAFVKNELICSFSFYCFK